MIFGNDNLLLYNYCYGDIDDDCMTPILQVFEKYDATEGTIPKTIINMDMGDYNISIATARDRFFVTVIKEEEKWIYKQHNTLFSLFIALGFGKYIRSHSRSYNPYEFFVFNESTFFEFGEKLNDFYNPETAYYVGFFINGNLEYSIGQIPENFNARTPVDPLDIVATLSDLSSATMFDPFAAYEPENEANVEFDPDQYCVSIQYFKHLQIGYVSKIPVNDDLIDQYTTQTIITKFTIPNLFLKNDENEEGEEMFEDDNEEN